LAELRSFVDQCNCHRRGRLQKVILPAGCVMSVIAEKIQMSRRRKVIILINDSLALQRMSLVVSGCDKFDVVGGFKDLNAATECLKNEHPDIVITEVDLPGANGIEAIVILRERYPEVECLMFTSCDDDEVIIESFRAGASGYIIRSSNYLELTTALYELIKGGAPMSAKVARTLVSSYRVNRQSPLSKRELQVMSMIAKGKNYREIADELQISKETSKTHIKNIYLKLKVRSRSGAIEMANRARWI
jgi:DNA-binding NarL/FixJ family response regulator